VRPRRSASSAADPLSSAPSLSGAGHDSPCLRRGGDRQTGRHLRAAAQTRPVSRGLKRPPRSKRTRRYAAAACAPAKSADKRAGGPDDGEEQTVQPGVARLQRLIANIRVHALTMRHPGNATGHDHSTISGPAAFALSATHSRRQPGRETGGTDSVTLSRKDASRPFTGSGYSSCTR